MINGTVNNVFKQFVPYAGRIFIGKWLRALAGYCGT
jgi:hypothetical protein